MADDDPQRDETAALREEIDAVERTALRKVEPGATAVTLAVGIMLLLAATSLPWVGGFSGWEVLRGSADPEGGLSFLLRLFSFVSLGFGGLLSAVALVTRRWGLVWASAFGCGYATVDGMWAIWSRQTVEGPGPGIGLVLAAVAVLLLASQWFRLALSRR